MSEQIAKLLDGIVWGESPRWRHDKLWFSDIFGKQVKNVDLEGNATLIADVPTIPSGLGWGEDGNLLIATGAVNILKQKNGEFQILADLSHSAVGINDMVVDTKSNAYVGCYGYDVRTYQPGMDVDAWVTLVRPDGSFEKVADGMICPNGMVISEDQKKLIVADTFAKQLLSFDILPDGGLSNRHVWADLEGGPDGITMDKDGNVWAAIPHMGIVIQVEEGGTVLQNIRFNKTPLACTLGGPNGDILFVVTVDAHKELSEDDLKDQDAALSKKGSCIEYISVGAKGFGTP
ncbi:SMP-30/gluconolactonase/LRE family protein [uncultured Draconibacterium sp.]|uniref:SMP-30/gluconolactonase/LRE family protein n=1 Tax=uncultured Draconibacterium sp. TaxID=1573823 RepID=UPI0025D171C8|nr:SMP-30/gluconolactonase/LRE family protein [uncultured Draconibacterium sp.]